MFKNLIDEKLRLIAGEPIHLEDYGEIHPKKIIEIIRHGFTRYSEQLHLLTIDLKDLIGEDDVDESLSVLDVIILFGGEDLLIEFEKALSFFLGGEVKTNKKSMLIEVKKEKDTLIVNRDNYKSIVQVLKYQNFIDSFDEKDLLHEGESEETRAFRKKMEEKKRETERLKKKKGNEDEEDGINFYDIVSSLSTKSYSINELNVFDLTIYQLYVKFKRMEVIDKYDIDIKSLLAGASSKEVKLKHWSTKI